MRLRLARYLSMPFATLALMGALLVGGLCPLPRPAMAVSLDEAVALAPTVTQDDFWIEVDNNLPSFSPEVVVAECFESYSELDSLGRCGAALACIGPDLLPTEQRSSIGMVKPSGWQIAKYDFVDGAYLYNRCHLIAFKLSGQNANELNLITGTRAMNIQGMDPFEDIVLDYIRATGNHVLYRVTPVFEGDNLVASGVQMEGWSVEDGGAGVCFNVFVYNRQPGVVIDYATGANWLDDLSIPEAVAVVEQPTEETTAQPAQDDAAITYILNTNTHKFHVPGCSSVRDMKESNKLPFSGSRDEAIAQGYVPCKRCNP